jgi:DNA invertase Pin-like site-specific DNA recombinase
VVKIGYVRVSRENQDPDYQIELMKKNGIAQKDIFIDHGFSGWSDPTIRPVYKKLRERLKVGDVTEILFSEFSRLGRNAKESMYELLQLEHMGIRVQSLSEHECFLNDLPGATQIQVLSGMMAGAEMQLAHIRENTKRGLNRVRERGSKSGKPIGRPKVLIDWEKIEKTMEQYKVPEKVAARICGYNESTFYKAKRERK